MTQLYSVPKETFIKRLTLACPHGDVCALFKENAFNGVKVTDTLVSDSMISDQMYKPFLEQTLQVVYLRKKEGKKEMKKDLED